MFDEIKEKNYEKILNNLSENNDELKEIIQNTYGNNEKKWWPLHIKLLDKNEHLDKLYNLMEKYH